MPPPIVPEVGEVVVVEPTADPKPKVKVGPLAPAGSACDAEALACLGERMAGSLRTVAARAGLALTRVAVRVRPEDPDRCDSLALDVILEGPLERRERDYLMRMLELYARRGGSVVRKA